MHRVVLTNFLEEKGSNTGGDTNRSKVSFASTKSFDDDYYDDAEESKAKAKDKILKAARKKPILALCNIDEEGLPAAGGKAVFFVRNTSNQVDMQTPEQDLTFGEVNDAVYEDFVALLSEVYYPILSKQEDWGKAPTESVRDFVSNMGR